MVVNYNLDEIEKAVSALFTLATESKVMAFQGKMGAGKTTLITALCKKLDVKDVVSSPTFSIINEYHTGMNKRIFHIDLYRLKSAAEAVAAGVEDCLLSGDLCLLEWPEIAPEIMPSDTLFCELNSVGDKARKLQINM